ncbi:MAG: hypothetical protein L0Y35_08880 [Flammeovirgaceae bacterium]|nr:hypothetical protein [Flammeovirgaceae bacterium]
MGTKQHQVALIAFLLLIVIISVLMIIEVEIPSVVKGLMLGASVGLLVKKVRDIKFRNQTP